jgi:hypothetical protein
VNGTRACNGQALQVKKKETSKSDLPQRDIRGEEKIIGSRKKMLNTEKQGGRGRRKRLGRVQRFSS